MKVNRAKRIESIDDYVKFVDSQKQSESDTCENVATIYFSESMVNFIVEYTVSHADEKGYHVVAYCDVAAYKPENCVELIKAVRLLKLDLKLHFIEITNYTHIIEDTSLDESELDHFLNMCEDYYSDIASIKL